MRRRRLQYYYTDRGWNGPVEAFDNFATGDVFGGEGWSTEWLGVEFVRPETWDDFSSHSVAGGEGWAGTWNDLDPMAGHLYFNGEGLYFQGRSLHFKSLERALANDV